MTLHLHYYDTLYAMLVNRKNTDIDIQKHNYISALKSNIIIRCVAIVLLLAFSLQNIVWANPEIAKPKKRTNTLQVQSSFMPPANPEILL